MVSDSRSYVSLLWSLGILVCFALLSLSFYYGLFTGFAGLSLKNDPLVAGSLITGTLSYDLSKGPLPLDTEVTLTVGGYEKTATLAQLYDSSSFKPELVEFSPLIKVTVMLKETSSSSSGGGGVLVVGVDPNNPPAATPPSFGEFGGGISSEAISPITTYETYYVRAGSVFETTIPSKRTASVFEARLAGNDELIDSSDITLKQDGASIALISRYQESVKGFALSDSLDSLPLSLDAFKFILSQRAKSPTTLTVDFSYKGDIFADLKEQMSVSVASLSSGSNPPSGSSSSPSGSQSSTSPPSGSSSSPSGSQSSTSPPPESSCENPICTPFGACAIPPFERSGARTLQESSYVRSSQCLCEDGTTFLREETCTSGPDGSIAITPGVGDPSEPGDPSSTPLGRLPTPSTSVGGGGDNRGGSSWEHTYSFDDNDFIGSGGVAQTLSENERIDLPVGNERHSIGVLDIDYSRDVPRVLVEVASTPKRFYLDLGETKSFDVQGDSVSDVSVTFVSLASRTRAVLKVIPLDAVAFSSEVHTGERAATLLRLPDEVPVAYVILNDDLPALRVFFVQSPILLSPTCSDSILNGDEIAVDCGGSCSSCREEKAFLAPYLAWIFVLLLFVALVVVSRKTRV